MCKALTQKGIPCKLPAISGSDFCAKHQDYEGCGSGGCKKAGCSKDATVSGMFCDEHEDGKTTCQFKTMTGKICGNAVKGSNHPYCSKHGKQAGIPIYSSCAVTGCNGALLSGWKVCEQHSKGCLAPISTGGVCGLKLGRNKKCKLHPMMMDEDPDIQSLTCGVNGCTLSPQGQGKKCMCSTCNKPAGPRSLWCPTHQMQECQRRFALYNANR